MMGKMSDKELLELCMKLNKKHVEKLDRMDKQITRLKADNERLAAACKRGLGVIKSITFTPIGYEAIDIYNIKKNIKTVLLDMRPLIGGSE